MKKCLLIAAAILTSTIGLGAQAATVIFDGNGQAADVFADGSFSANLSGQFPDGFYNDDPSQATSTSAYNGFGQNGEFISFNNPVTLNSLSIQKCDICFDAGPVSFTAEAFDSSGNLLEELSTAATDGPSQLVFDEAGVSKIEFLFSGGFDLFGTGSNAAYYVVSDINYTVSAVPLPGALPLFGSAIVGIGLLSRRRSRQAT